MGTNESFFSRFFNAASAFAGRIFTFKNSNNENSNDSRNERKTITLKIEEFLIFMEREKHL